MHLLYKLHMLIINIFGGNGRMAEISMYTFPSGRFYPPISGFHVVRETMKKIFQNLIEKISI